VISFDRYKLENGLTVILHQDLQTSLVAVNMLYKVGSRNENQYNTGFAHLFEHLMFTGTKNVPDFDIPIQEAGGENNAFTNTDITNYYNLVPADNLDIALYVEADRLANLNLDNENVEVQKKVVVEEFYETCLNQPYGDLWHHLSELSYKEHHYRWPTIGLAPEHISKIKVKEAQDFYKSHYQAANAILVIAGNFSLDSTKDLIDKYFKQLPKVEIITKTLPEEPAQNENREKVVEADVPFNALMISFPMPDRKHPDFAIYDLVSDILANGRSSRFFKNLFKDADLFNYIDAYLSATEDAGLFIIDARLEKGISFNEAEEAIWNEINLLVNESISKEELDKVINKNISSLVFSEMSVLNKAINLAYYESIGDASEINDQQEQYECITIEDIQRVSRELFQKNKSNVLRYGNIK
jgi:predicted Zn-dependent peptidase